MLGGTKVRPIAEVGVLASCEEDLFFGVKFSSSFEAGCLGFEIFQLVWWVCCLASSGYWFVGAVYGVLCVEYGVATAVLA